MVIDLDTQDIEIRKSGVDKFIYDGATGNLAITGIVTFLSGTSGVSNITGLGDLAVQDESDLGLGDLATQDESDLNLGSIAALSSISFSNLNTTIIDGAYIKTGIINTGAIVIGDLSGAGDLAGLDTVAAAQMPTIIIGGYLSTGLIEADSIVAGKLSVTNLADIANLEIGTTGYIRSAGKTSFTDTTAGFWIGYDSAYKLVIGDSTNSLKWDGTYLEFSGKISGVTAGNNLDLAIIDTELTQTISSSTWVKEFEVLIARKGTYRVKFSIMRPSGNAEIQYVRIYKNGTGFGTTRTSGAENTTTAVFSQDLAFDVSDLMQFYTSSDYFNFGEPSCELQNAGVYVTNPITTIRIPDLW